MLNRSTHRWHTLGSVRCAHGYVALSLFVRLAHATQGWPEICVYESLVVWFRSPQFQRCPHCSDLSAAGDTRHREFWSGIWPGALAPPIWPVLRMYLS